MTEFSVLLTFVILVWEIELLRITLEIRTKFYRYIYVHIKTNLIQVRIVA